MSAFYKTNHPQVMEALSHVRAATDQLRAEGDALAIALGGKAAYSFSISGQSFAGLVLTPPGDTAVWTVPEKQLGLQRPRAKPKAGASAEVKQEHRQLIELWRDKAPARRVSGEALFEAIGTNWGQLLFSGISYIERDGWLYVKTSTTLNDRMTEILGSEYARAKEGSPS